MKITRRNFIKSSLALTASTYNSPLKELLNKNDNINSWHNNMEPITQQTHFISDGLNLTPAQYSKLLASLTESSKFEGDDYCLGGIITELENTFARMLNKERAIFMPTGTMANHLALRALANGGRIIVQEESHVYNDVGDCLQTLSSLNLIPLAPAEATFSLNDVKKVLARTAAGRVSTHVGAISIENPVRRCNGQVFNMDELKQIVALAKDEKIKLHLDGARLFIASAYTNISPAQYAEPFDTVYISLYKYFNAAGGAILAGPNSIIENMYHTRRMFGGGLSEGWPYAAVALHYLEGFNERFGRAVKNAQALFKMLNSNGKLQVQPIANGTNIFKLILKEGDPQKFRDRLKETGITLGKPKENNSFNLTVNESINSAVNGANINNVNANNANIKELAEKFIVAAGK